MSDRLWNVGTKKHPLVLNVYREGSEWRVILSDIGMKNGFDETIMLATSKKRNKAIEKARQSLLSVFGKLMPDPDPEAAGNE